MSVQKNSVSVQDRKLIIKVAVTLACKLAIIACLFMLFFSPEHRVQTDAQTVSRALLSPEAASIDDTKAESGKEPT